MPWQKPRRNWKQQHPTRLEDAFHLCKEHGRERGRLSVERLADLMAVKPSTLYKWMEEGSMPSNRIAQFEHFCGIHFVSEYLAAGAGRVVIEIPAGHRVDAEDLGAMQEQITGAVLMLMRCWRGKADIDETVVELTAALQSLAFQREAVRWREQPELGLET